MEKFTNDELIEMLSPELQTSNELSKKQKALLGQLIIYNGLDETKDNGYFYRSNSDLCRDCDISEKTLITAVNKLERMRFIERKKGSRTIGASEYKIDEHAIDDYCKTNYSNNYSNEYCKNDYSNNYSKVIAEMSDKIRVLENTVKMLLDKITVIEEQNSSTETETEIEKEVEKEPIIINDIVYKDVLLSNNINDNLKDDLNDSLSVVQSKEDNLINNLKKDDIMEENGFLENDYFFNEGLYQELEKDLRNEVDSKPCYDGENKETLNKTIDEILERVQKLKLIKRNKINLFNEVKGITYNRLKEPITYILREPLNKFFEKSLDTSTGEKDVVQMAESSLDIAC